MILNCLGLSFLISRELLGSSFLKAKDLPRGSLDILYLVLIIYTYKNYHYHHVASSCYDDSYC